MQSSMMSRRRRASKTASNHPDRLKKRDIAFTHQTVSVVKKLGEFGTSYLYSAKDDSAPRREGKALLIKATAAATTEQARRAEAEVGLLRKLSGAPGIPTIIDCGFSTIEERLYDDNADDDRLEARRLYCVLLEPCPDFFLNEFIKKRRRKYSNKGSRSLFTRKKKDTPWEGYLPIDTILDIFGQMVSAISAIHNFKDETATIETPSTREADGRQSQPQGIVHLDVQPSRFLVRRMKEKVGTEHRYDVKLCSFGCSIRGGMPIASTIERDEASKLIESSSSPMYRSPEMIDLSLADELNTSADIWGLGCCLYELLFLTECFKSHSKQKLLRGIFLLPAKHPYAVDVIELLARMLTVNSIKRATIEEVQDCLTSLKKGESMPPRRSPSPPLLVDQGPLTRLEGLGKLGELSNQLEGEPTEEIRIPTSGAHHISSIMNTDSFGDGDTTDYQPGDIHESHADGGCSSDGTEFSQWLEFKPGSSDGLNLEKRVAPLPFATRIIQRGSIRRRKRYNDPLSLGAASASLSRKDDKKQKLFSDRKLGPINQLSSRSLNPIDANASEGSGSGEKDNGITPVVKPSLRMINPYGLALKTKDSPGVGRSYGAGRFLSSGPSLRVSDLMKSHRFHGTSTSSSEICSSSNNDVHGSDFMSSMEGPNTSSEFYSSIEMPSSSDVGVSSTELTMSASEVSQSVTHHDTPMTGPSKLTSIDEMGSRNIHSGSSHDASWAIDAPLSALSAPVRMERSSMSTRGFSPNVPPAPFLLSMSNSGMISPKDFTRPSRNDEVGMGSLYASDSRLELKKTKKSKDKSKKRKKKSKKAAKSDDDPALHKHIDDVVAETSVPEKQVIASYGGMEELGEDRSAVADIDADADQLIERDILSFGNSKLDNWGSISSIGHWAAASQELSAKKSHKKRKSKKSKSEQESSMIMEDQVDSISAQDPWDLKAAEKWVATRSNEASALTPHSNQAEDAKARREKYWANDPRSMKTADSLPGTRVPDDWVTDAKLWVTDESPTKVSKIRKELKETASGRFAECEVDAAWFATPVAKTRLLADVKPTIDAAGFPLSPRVGIGRAISERQPPGRRLERNSRPFQSSPLDGRFSTPQPQRGKVEVPRSAVSMNELSKSESRRAGRSSSFKTLDSAATNRFSVDSDAKIKRTKSGSTLKSSKTLNSHREPSVDSNIPPGDVVVGAEVSVPLARGSKMSVKDAVHMALTAEGRHMKRSIKKMEVDSPHRLLAKMLLHEKEPDTEKKKSHSTEASFEDKSRDATRSKSTRSMKIPSMIQLVSPGDAGDGVQQPSSASSNIQTPLGASPPPPFGTGRFNELPIPVLEGRLTGRLPPKALERDGSKKAKKKKQGKERKSERTSAKK